MATKKRKNPAVETERRRLMANLERQRLPPPAGTLFTLPEPADFAAAGEVHHYPAALCAAAMADAIGPASKLIGISVFSGELELGEPGRGEEEEHATVEYLMDVAAAAYMLHATGDWTPHDSPTRRFIENHLGGEWESFYNPEDRFPFGDGKPLGKGGPELGEDWLSMMEDVFSRSHLEVMTCVVDGARVIHRSADARLAAEKKKKEAA